MKQKILFVINTLGRAGAENALLSLLKLLDPAQYDISLYVTMGQGELRAQLPPWVQLKNPAFSTCSVLTAGGRRRMAQTVVRAFFCNGEPDRKIKATLAAWKSAPGAPMDKLLWRMMAMGSCRFDETYDLAVAYLEGGATYYVADYVRAKKKAAFVHIDYESSGYTKQMDNGCYAAFDRIFAVSEETKQHFLRVYPEYRSKTEVFHNVIDQQRIRRLAEEPGGFSDAFEGLRLLTVGRLIHQKAYDVAIQAMARLKASGACVRWYVLGEGSRRTVLERQIAACGLQKDFLLLGATANPYPYYAQTGLYIHATRFEGKSIAIQEAQTLGCAVIASDCNGNREQIEDGVDGILCRLEPEALAAAILRLAGDQALRQRLGQAACRKKAGGAEELDRLLQMAGTGEKGDG